MKYLLMNATGYATELSEFFERYLAHFEMTFDLETMPPELAALTAPLMEPLRGLRLYQPYLDRYGLGDANASAATAAE